MKRVKRFLGLKGSWKWACRQMGKGLTVTRSGNVESAKYSLDNSKKRLILWTFTELDPPEYWDKADLYLSDFEATDWVKVKHIKLAKKDRKVKNKF